MLVIRVVFALAIFVATTSADYKLAVLHANDHHSRLESNHIDLASSKFGFISDVRVHYGGYPRMATAYKSLKAALVGSGYNVMKLHAGDAITGSPYFSLFKGQADAKLMGHVCFDAMALGNHEFDEGDAVLANFLDMLNNQSNTCSTGTRVLGANIVPGPSSPLRGKIAKSHTFLLNSELVGVVGIDIKMKTEQSSSPSPGTRLTDEKIAAQAEIDSLVASGVNKIILLTHIGYDLDMSWMTQLNNVDIVIGGDSHSLLGDARTQEIGFNMEGVYPTEATNGNGKKVCVATAWEYSKCIGQLEVVFDDHGDVKICGGSPKFAFDGVSMNFKDGSSTALSEAEADTVASYLTGLGSQWLPATEDSAATDTLDIFQDRVSELKMQQIAHVPTLLCLDRFPGSGSSVLCAKNETAMHGGPACQLVSKAFLQITKSADFTIQNAGGCRTDIEAGEFSVNDAYLMLPFSNTLVTVQLSGWQVKALLEDALDFALSPSGSAGAYPYASGLRWALNANETKGSRFGRVQVNSRLAGTWADIDDAATYTVATNSFIAGGKDGYLTFTSAAGIVDTFTQYAEGLVAYSREVKTLVSPPLEEFSTQAYTDKYGVEWSTWGSDRHVSVAGVGAPLPPAMLALALLGLACG